MSNSSLRPSSPVERLDADAVCEQCGTVNPEETLICKTCGNNLRDQRARRALLDQVAEGVDLGPTGGVWIGRLAIVFGILVLFWVAINFDRIYDFMVSAQTTTLGNARVFWSGAKGQVFDQMAAELKANPVTPQEASQALSQPTPTDKYDGRYVLVPRGQAQRTPIGQAIVRTEGSTVRFVAELTGVRAEIRGEASPEGQARLTARDTAGVYVKGEYYGVTGFAQILDTGGFECLGLRDLNDQTYSAVAYRVP